MIVSYTPTTVLPSTPVIYREAPWGSTPVSPDAAWALAMQIAELSPSVQVLDGETPVLRILRADKWLVAHARQVGYHDWELDFWQLPATPADADARALALTVHEQSSPPDWSSRVRITAWHMRNDGDLARGFADWTLLSLVRETFRKPRPA